MSDASDGRVLGGDRQFTRHGIAERTAAREGDPHCADRGLRSFPRWSGDACLCAYCDGQGLVIRRTGWSGVEAVIEPVKCPVCNGEGLDPKAYQGVE